MGTFAKWRPPLRENAVEQLLCLQLPEARPRHPLIWILLWDIPWNRISRRTHKSFSFIDLSKYNGGPGGI